MQEKKRRQGRERKSSIKEERWRLLLPFGGVDES
jgi:hypothetical protein